MNIKRASVLLTLATDRVMLWTDLPSPLPKVTQEPLVVTFEAEHNTGVNYVRQIFALEPEVVSIR